MAKEGFFWQRESEQANYKYFYVDSDGDIISISNERDFKEALLVKPDRIIVAKDVQEAKESIGFINMQRSSVLSQSILNQSFMSQMSGNDQPISGAYGQLRGYTGNQVLQGILMAAAGGRQQ